MSAGIHEGLAFLGVRNSQDTEDDDPDPGVSELAEECLQRVALREDGVEEEEDNAYDECAEEYLLTEVELGSLSAYVQLVRIQFCKRLEVALEDRGHRQYVEDEEYYYGSSGGEQVLSLVELDTVGLHDTGSDGKCAEVYALKRQYVRTYVGYIDTHEDESVLVGILVVTGSLYYTFSYLVHHQYGCGTGGEHRQ